VAGAIQEEELHVHELAICDSIARVVTQHAAGRPVRSVKLRVGALRQVVPESLDFCWSVVTRDPVLAGSVLDIELVPAEVECVECGAQNPLSRFVLCCPACEGPVSVLSGEELLIVSIDVEDGEDGEDGERGEDGEKGDVAASSSAHCAATQATAGPARRR
jgi:hydrogenase nickel incorporation protein HypA/HybF